MNRSSLPLRHVVIAHLSILFVTVLGIVARIPIDAPAGWPWVAADVTFGVAVAIGLLVSLRLAFVGPEQGSADR